MKICAKCLIEKTTSEFNKCKSNRDGLYGYCRPCGKVYQKKYNEIRERQPYDPEKGRVAQLKYTYGITVEQYHIMLAEQGGGCKACGRKPEQGRRNFHVDHDHGCCPGGNGKKCGNCIRGILCHQCNTVLGMVQDDVQRLDDLKAYLLNFAS